MLIKLLSGKYTLPLLWAAVIVTYFFLSTSFLLEMPQVWPDEAYLADIALNYQKTGRIGTDLWGNTIIGIKDSFYWYPPVYLYILAYWFKFFGFSIVTMRMLSVILGAFFLIIFYLYSSRFFLSDIPNTKKRLVLVCTLFLMVIDNTFLKAVRLGRAEILVLVWGLLSLCTLHLAQSARKKKWIFYAITGFILAMAFLTHFLSIVFTFAAAINILFFKKLNDLKHNYIILVVSFLIPVILWLFNIYPNFYIFLEQLSLQREFRLLVDTYLISVFKYAPIEQKAIYCIYLALSLLFLLFSFIKKTKQYFIILILLGLSWALYIFGKLEWYSVYPVVFIYLSAYLLISQTFLTKPKQSKIFSFPGKLTFILIIILFVLNFIIYFKAFQFNNQHKDLYLNFSKEVKNIIPPEKTVYLSTTPDLYFTLKNRNQLYEFPSMRVKIKDYINLLNNTDYIIINFHLERMFIGNVLYKYIELNKLKEYEVGKPELYQAQIIELRPKNQRSDMLQ